jgi:hypothetical protein
VAGEKADATGGARNCFPADKVYVSVEFGIDKSFQLTRTCSLRVVCFSHCRCLSYCYRRVSRVLLLL